MPCIHGIDEINCPVCRVSISSRPINIIAKITSDEKDFLIKSPFIQDFASKDGYFEEELDPKNKFIQPKIINPLPKPNLINEIRLSENISLMEQLKNKDLEKFDQHGISKRVPIKKGNLEFK